jgi:hypothetical protein
MKKVILVFAVMVALASCAPKSTDNTVVTNDTVVVDTLAVDTLVVDTLVVE